MKLKTLKMEKIVVPWDGSEMASDALLAAAELAQDLKKIEVIEVTPYVSAADPSVIWETYSEEVIAQKVEENFRQETANLLSEEVSFSVRFGDPGVQIAAFSEEIDADLVVISSHGRTGISRLLLGSVAERVVRLAPCPVLVLRQS